jgi:hypothetical protein
MIHYQIKKYVDNGEENFLQIEIIKPNEFNNDIVDIYETYETLLEIYILLKSNDGEMIEDYLNDLLQIDDSPHKRGEK